MGVGGEGGGSNYGNSWAREELGMVCLCPLVFFAIMRNLVFRKML